MTTKYDYTKVDPILKKNPDISFVEFKKICTIEITNWSFLSRKSLIKGVPGYGRKMKKKSKTKTKEPPVFTLDTGESITLKDGTKTTIEELITVMYPFGKLQSQYKVVAKALLENPLTTHSSMINSGAITMSDSNFYMFRRMFTKSMGLKSNGKHRDKKSKAVTPVKAARKKNVLYQTIFQKDIKENQDPKAMELLQEFVDALNQDKSMVLEIFEIIRPHRMIEIRSLSK